MKTYQYVLEKCKCGEFFTHFVIDPIGGWHTWKHTHPDCIGNKFGVRTRLTIEEVEA